MLRNNVIIIAETTRANRMEEAVFPIQMVAYLANRPLKKQQPHPAIPIRTRNKADNLRTKDGKRRNTSIKCKRVLVVTKLRLHRYLFTFINFTN